MSSICRHNLNPTVLAPRGASFRLLMKLVLASAALVTQIGCSSPDGPTKLELTVAQYPAAFEAAKDAVRELRFPLERVDYTNGEITTDRKFTSGLATPWDREQSTIENEWEDFTNLQDRVIRIRFQPASLAASGEADAPATQVNPINDKPVADAGEPIVAEVVVTLYRINRPGWQPQTKAVRRSSFTEDPELTARGMFPSYEVAVTRDEKLAARIIKSMQEQMKKTPVATGSAAPSGSLGERANAPGATGE